MNNALKACIMNKVFKIKSGIEMNE